jgi:hypothetical protein
MRLEKQPPFGFKHLTKVGSREPRELLGDLVVEWPPKWPPTKKRWGPPARQRFLTSYKMTVSRERATGLEPATSSLGRRAKPIGSSLDALILDSRRPGDCVLR